MVVFIGVLGESGAGKTTLIEEVTRSLVAKGQKVATVKYSSHEVFDLEGKDTRRFRDAGAEIVIGISSKETMIIKGRDRAQHTLEDIRSMAGNSVDLIIIEGYRSLVLNNEQVLKIILAEDDTDLVRFSSVKGGAIAMIQSLQKPARSSSIFHIIDRGEVERLVKMLEEEISKKNESTL